MHCLLILPLICSYMWDLASKTHIWCISGFVLKIGYYTCSTFLLALHVSKNVLTSALLAASTSSSVFSYGSLVVFGIFVFKAFLFAAGGWSDLCVSADDLFLLDAAPAGADVTATVVGIGGGSGAGGACCCGGDSAAGSVGASLFSSSVMFFPSTKRLEGGIRSCWRWFFSIYILLKILDWECFRYSWRCSYVTNVVLSKYLYKHDFVGCYVLNQSSSIGHAHRMIAAVVQKSALGNTVTISRPLACSTWV